MEQAKLLGERQPPHQVADAIGLGKAHVAERQSDGAVLPRLAGVRVGRVLSSSGVSKTDDDGQEKDRREADR
jgi:hypothetical protein